MDLTGFRIDPIQQLHHWFQNNQRSFPWRVARSPYKVWISEIMLQQTRASVVIPYFERWLIQFPHIQALAQATLEEVIKAWEGLGYYSRARAVHETARLLLQNYGGELPPSREALATLKGLGPYTIGAILSFGFHQRASAIDGNTARVLARYFWLEEWIDTTSAKKKLEALSNALLDPEKPWITVEALIELGASICLPQPRCHECPLQETCIAHKKENETLLPLKKPKATILSLQRVVTIIESDGSFLLQKGGPGQLMADLYQFPYFDIHHAQPSIDTIQKEILQKWRLSTEWVETLPSLSQSFTRYKVKLFPYCFKTVQSISLPGMFWISKHCLSSLPFSAGHRKLLPFLMNH